MNFSELTVKEYLQNLSSSNTAPGANSVAPLYGALGISLTHMVVCLTQNRKQHARYDEVLQKITIEIMQIQNELINNIDKDKSANEAVISAHSLVNNTSVQRIKRQEEIEISLKQATQIPFETITLCYEGLRLTKLAMNKITEFAIADLEVGAIGLNAAVKASFLNIITNANHIKDMDFVNVYRKGAQDLLTKSENIFKEINSYCITELLKK